MINGKHVQDVREWHDKFMIKPPAQMSEMTQFLDLRTKIMEEEIQEYLDAGTDLVERADAITDIYFIAQGTVALYEDAEKGIRNVMSGYMSSTLNFHCNLLEYFINLEENKLIKDKLTPLFKEVLRSNHTKADADGNPIFREDGKLIKSDLFEEPNLREVLFYEDY